MGLDQYVYAIDVSPAEVADIQDDNCFEFNPKEKFEKLTPTINTTVAMSEYLNEIPNKTIYDFWYWRKHPDIQEWMEQLYISKGGEKSINGFNSGQWVELTPEDLDELELAVENEDLPETKGMCFGESSPEMKIYDLEFIDKARMALEEGKRLYYTSWW